MHFMHILCLVHDICAYRYCAQDNHRQIKQGYMPMLNIDISEIDPALLHDINDEVRGWALYEKHNHPDYANRLMRVRQSVISNIKSYSTRELDGRESSFVGQARAG